jgi:hypothetical protein
MTLICRGLAASALVALNAALAVLFVTYEGLSGLGLLWQLMILGLAVSLFRGGRCRRFGLGVAGAGLLTTGAFLAFVELAPDLADRLLSGYADRSLPLVNLFDASLSNAGQIAFYVLMGPQLCFELVLGLPLAVTALTGGGIVSFLWNLRRPRASTTPVPVS